MLTVAGANHPKSANTLAMSDTRTRFMAFSDCDNVGIVRRNQSGSVFHSIPNVLV